MHGIKRYLILTLMILLPINAIADNIDSGSSAGSKLLWITSAFFSNSTLIAIPCIEIPKSPSFHTNSINLNLSTSSGTWVPTSAYVEKDKMLKFSWSTKGIKPRPRKYLVLYRIDPRFDEPQLFIQQWDYIKEQYITDFPKPGSDISYYQRYFKDVARKTMRVEAGDVVNITLVDPSMFFNSNNIFTNEFDDKLFYKDKIYTPSNIENKIIYSLAKNFCNLVDPANNYCDYVGTDLKYSNKDKFAFAGKVMQKGFDANYPAFVACPASAQGNDAACFYDKGRGMKVLLNGDNIIKGMYESFIHSNVADVDFLYYKSTVSGYLDITTDFNNMYGKNLNLDISTGLPADFLHFGRYALNIDIGNGENIISTADQDAIKVEYTIAAKESGTVDPNVSGINIAQDYKNDSYASGYLWVRVLNPHTEIQGSINVGYGYYSGNTLVSDLIYNKIAAPLRKKFNNISKIIYNKLTKDPTLKRISKTMLTLYILIYGLLFLVGSIKITIMDIVTRVIKVAIIVVLFSEDSWNFFNNNLFRVLVDGTDYLISNITGVTSSKANIFGFIDPIFDKYCNIKIWSLLLAQLFQIQNGLCFFAIMVVYKKVD